MRKILALLLLGDSKNHNLNVSASGLNNSWRKPVKHPEKMEIKVLSGSLEIEYDQKKIRLARIWKIYINKYLSNNAVPSANGNETFLGAWHVFVLKYSDTLFYLEATISMTISAPSSFFLL
jgi:hypothetical protein